MDPPVSVPIETMDDHIETLATEPEEDPPGETMCCPASTVGGFHPECAARTRGGGGIFQCQEGIDRFSICDV